MTWRCGEGLAALACFTAEAEVVAPRAARLASSAASALARRFISTCTPYSSSRSCRCTSAIPPSAAAASNRRSNTSPSTLKAPSTMYCPSSPAELRLRDSDRGSRGSALCGGVVGGVVVAAAVVEWRGGVFRGVFSPGSGGGGGGGGSGCDDRGWDCDRCCWLCGWSCSWSRGVCSSAKETLPPRRGENAPMMGRWLAADWLRGGDTIGDPRLVPAHVPALPMPALLLPLAPPNVKCPLPLGRPTLPLRLSPEPSPQRSSPRSLEGSRGELTVRRRSTGSSRWSASRNGGNADGIAATRCRRGGDTITGGALAASASA